MRYSTVLALLLITSTGCDSKVSPEVISLRSRLVATEEPANAITLTEAKDKLVEESEVTIIGRVGSGGGNPFDKNHAIFVLSEAPSGDHSHGDGTDEKECVFCRRRMEAAPLAHIELRDTAGNALSMRADQALGISEGQILVVKGRGKYDKELDNVTLIAEEVFIRQKHR
jgi:hypothetical protein